MSVPQHTISAMATTPRTTRPTASDRAGILFLEHAKIHTHEKCVVVSFSATTALIPTAALTAIFLGPGTSITHAAAKLCADDATTIVWTGSSGVRAYSAITSLAVRAELFHRQVSVWSDRQQRLAAARRLYHLRFPDETDTASMKMADLRAAEGRRVRDIYRTQTAAYGLTWTRRDTDWDRADDLNRAITTAYQALYGAALAVIQALGLHPALGFIHTGTHLAFVYDIADLHKTSLGLDIALQTCTEEPSNMERSTRTNMNHALRQHLVLPAMIESIHTILGAPETTVEQLTDDDLQLFDLRGNLPAGVNYAPTLDECSAC